MTSPLNYQGGRQFPQSILDDLDRRLKALESVSESANVAQGAEMHICGECDRQFRAAPPAQTALTEHDLRNIEGCLTGSGYVGTMAKVRAALTAAQSASGGKS